MKRIGPKQPPFRPDGQRMGADDFRTLHAQLAGFDKVEWIDAGARELVERFMPDRVDKLPDRTTETFDHRARAAVARKVRRHRKCATPPR